MQVLWANEWGHRFQGGFQVDSLKQTQVIHIFFLQDFFFFYGMLADVEWDCVHVHGGEGELQGVQAPAQLGQAEGVPVQAVVQLAQGQKCHWVELLLKDMVLRQG